MEQNKIKIYIADELDTIDSICNKFNISKQILLIFNPLLKGKTKITNTPIKIPYKKIEEENRETQVEGKKKVIDEKCIFLIKNVLICKYFHLPTLEEEILQLKKYPLVNNKLFNLILYMNEFIEIIKEQNVEEFNNYLNNISDKIDQIKNEYINAEEVIYSLLKYIIHINKKDYQESSLIINNLTINQISNFSS